MSRPFYMLSSPSHHTAASVYGNKGWMARYGDPDWGPSMDLPGLTCPRVPTHRRAGARTMDLELVLSSPKVGDFSWCVGECIMTERVRCMLAEAGFSGYEARPVTVARVKRHRELEAPQLWELKVTGRGGPAHRSCGIRVIYRCDACGMVRYSSYRNGITVDESAWDGSDFFTIDGYPRVILITERVKDVVVANELTNCAIIAARDVRWPPLLSRPEDDLLGERPDCT